VVAFINNDMPVFGDKVLHFAFTLQALKQADCLFSASAASNAAWVSSSCLMSTTHQSLGLFRVEDGEAFQGRNLTDNLVCGHEGI
jgi:hypothetical protein